MPDPIALRPSTSPAGGTAVAEAPAAQAAPATAPKAPTATKRGEDGKFKPRMDDAKIEDILSRSEAAHGFKPAPEEVAANGKAAQTDKSGTTDAKAGETPPKSDSPPKFTPDQLKTARSVLARDGWDAEDIGDVESRDPARLVRLSEKAAKRQADIDKKLSKQGAEGTDKTGQDTPEAKQGDTAQAKPGAKAPAFTLDRAAFKDEIQALSDEFGPASDRVVGFTEKVVQKFAEGMLSEVKSQLAEATKYQRSLAGVVEDLILTTNREALRGEIPELADEAAFQAVREEMALQAEARPGTPFRELMKLSARVRLGDQIEARRLAELKTRDRAKDNGSVDLDGAAGTPTPEVLDLEALEDNLLAELERPDRDEARVNAARQKFQNAKALAKRTQ